MLNLTLADFCKVFPLVDALAIAGTRCLLLLSDPADPALEQRRSALIAVDGERAEATLLGEFPGASALLLWATTGGGASWRVQALVASPGGHLWKLSPDGSVGEIYDAFDGNGPSRYGFLNCCAEHQGFAYVGGMCNQLYRVPLQQDRFERLDASFLDHEMEDVDSAVYGLADMDGKHVLAVGGRGMIAWLDQGVPRYIESGTNVMINAVSAFDGESFVACGAGGTVLRGSLQGGCEARDSGLAGAYLSDVRTHGQHHFWIADRKLYTSRLGRDWHALRPQEGAPLVSRFSRGGSFPWALSPAHLGWTRDGARWAWLETQSIRMLEPDGPSSLGHDPAA